MISSGLAVVSSVPAMVKAVGEMISLIWVEVGHDPLADDPAIEAGVGPGGHVRGGTGGLDDLTLLDVFDVGAGLLAGGAAGREPESRR